MCEYWNIICKLYQHCEYISTDFFTYVKHANTEIVFKTRQILCTFCVHFTNTWIIWYYLNIIVPVYWNMTMLIQRSSVKLQYSNVNVDIILETNHSWIFMAPLNSLYNWQPCLVSGHIIAKKYGCEIHTWYYFWHFLNSFQFVEVFLSCLVHVLNIANETINQMCSRWCINC